MKLRTLLESNLDGSVRWKHEHSRMAVEDADNVQPATGEVEARLGHLHVRIIAFLVVGVEYVQIESVRAEVSDEDFGGRVGNAVEDFVGVPDVRHSLEGEVADALDARADHNHRALSLVKVNFSGLKIPCADRTKQYSDNFAYER